MEIMKINGNNGKLMVSTVNRKIMEITKHRGYNGQSP